MEKFNKKVDYIILLGILGISGMPFFMQYEDELLIAFSLLSVFEFFRRKRKLDLYFLLFILVFIFLTGIHLITFNVFPQKTVGGLFLKILYAYLAIKVINKPFFDYYVNIMIFFSYISLLFWIPAFISGSFASFIIAAAPFDAPIGFIDKTYIIYHLNIYDLNSLFVRNCGPFWEPGAFSGLLVIAFIINYFKHPSIKNKNNIILLASILSTASTTGYIVLLLFSLFFSLTNLRIGYIIAVVVIVLPLSFYAFTSLPFLAEKLTYQYELSQTESAYKIHRTRITSAIVDIIDFQKYPFAGRGKYEQTRFDNDIFASNVNNGTTDFLVMFGILGFITYFYSYFRTFYYYFKFENLIIKFPLYFVILILILGLSENYFLLPFFWGLCFVNVNYQDSLS